MSKKFSVFSVICLMVLGCSVDTSFMSVSTSNKNSLDITKSVEIKILNPSNKSSVDWYKKNKEKLFQRDETIVMKVGSQADLIGTASLKDGTKSSNVTWSSSDNTIAVVNNGKITANKLGTTTVLATSNLDSAYKGILNVEVVDAANFSSSDKLNDVKSVEAYMLLPNDKISKATEVEGLVGSTGTCTATVTLTDGTKTSNVIWESSDENVASVNEDGFVTFKKIGQTTIVAKYKLNPEKKALITVDVKLLSNTTNNAPMSFNKNGDITGRWCYTETLSWQGNDSDPTIILKGTLDINKSNNSDIFEGLLTKERVYGKRGYDGNTEPYKIENSKLIIKLIDSTDKQNTYVNVSYKNNTIGNIISLTTGNTLDFNTEYSQIIEEIKHSYRPNFSFKINKDFDFKTNSMLAKIDGNSLRDYVSILLERNCN